MCRAAGPLRCRPRPVIIRATGRFRVVERTGGFVLLVRGRFVTRDRVRIVYRSCGIRRTRLTAHRTGPINRDCRSHRAKTLLRTAAGRIFQEFVWRPGAVGPAATAGSMPRTAVSSPPTRPFALGQDDDDDFDLGSFRLVAPYVGYEERACVGLGCGYSVTVRDLRDGGKLREAPEPATDSFGKVTDLELKANGSVLDSEQPSVFPDPARSVWASDSLGTRRLDNRPIALESLALNGSFLSWVNGGLGRSAVLE